MLKDMQWNETRSAVFNSLRPHGLYSPWNSPGQNTGVGSLSLLQGIFPIQGVKPGLPHCRRILYQLSHKGSPRILEWGSLSLLQGIFLTQELNQHLQHCRWILYQLSYQESPEGYKFLYLLFLKNNQPKIILVPKRHIWGWQTPGYQQWPKRVTVIKQQFFHHKDYICYPLKYLAAIRAR